MVWEGLRGTFRPDRRPPESRARPPRGGWSSSSVWENRSWREQPDKECIWFWKGAGEWAVLWPAPLSI